MLEEALAGDEVQVPLLWACCTCLPHVRPVQAKKGIHLLKKAIAQVTQMFTETKNNVLQDELSVLLWKAVHGLYLFTCDNPDQFFAIVTEERIKDLLRVTPSNPHVLRVANLFYTFAKPTQNCTKHQDCDEVYDMLCENLSSSASVVRLLTLHILSQFEVTMPTLTDGLVLKQPGVFRICLDAELTPYHATHFREKLRHLNKLDYELIQNQIPEGDEKYQLVPLRYLLGTLYVNFFPIWKPILNVIATHASLMPRELFWSVFGQHLEAVIPLAEECLYRHIDEQTLPRGVTAGTSSACHPAHELLTKQMSVLGNMSERVDHVNVRRLLWQAMELFAPVAEAKSRAIVPLLFRFLDNEYYPADVAAALHKTSQRKPQIVKHKKSKITVWIHLYKIVRNQRNLIR